MKLTIYSLIALVGIIGGLALINKQDYIVFKLEAPVGFPEMKVPEKNEYSKARYELGRKIFFDPILSIDSSISCASCHKPALAFADDKSFSPGVFDRPGTRNAPSLINVGYNPVFLREGSVKTLEMQVLVPIQEKNEFAHNIVDISAKMKLDSTYVKMGKQAYNREIDPYVITRSLSVFQRTLVGGDSKWDEFKQENVAFTKKEKLGMELFFSEKTNCSNCHGGFAFTEFQFRNNGLYSNYEDNGRFRFTHDSTDLALFKVPSLRNVQITKPYMHDGSIHSLKEVIEHYNSGGANHKNKSEFIRPLNLNKKEKQALVLFLNTLTDKIYLN